MATTVPRRYYHPIQKDYATFLETSASTGGRRTLIEIELAPGGGNPPHYHTNFSERFEVLEGELQVLLGRETQTLRPGETKTAQEPLPSRCHFCARRGTDAWGVCAGDAAFPLPGGASAQKGY